MSNYRNTFHFTGEVSFPKEDSKNPFYAPVQTDKIDAVKMNFGIKESDHNMGFVEIFGSKRDPIHTMNTDNEAIDVAWDDRFKPEVIKEVANYRKYTVDLGKECGGRYDFITQYDMIEFLHNYLPQFKGRVYVTGQFSRQPYKDKYYNHFSVENVYGLSEDDDKHKNRLGVMADIFYNNKSLDITDVKNTGKAYLSGYISQYISADKKNEFVPMDFVFNTKAYDMSNEHQKTVYEYKMNNLKPKETKIVHIPWELVMLNGAEEQPFDESTLTNAQKEQIALGLSTVDDFKPKGSIFGNNVKEFRLFKPILKGDFAGGLVKADYSDKDFQDAIYVPVTDESIVDIEKTDEKSNKGWTEDMSDLDDESLF